MNKPKNILVVDDNHENLSFLCKLLKEEGYIPHPADSGELALASLENITPDLILLDIQMTGISGFEVCKRIKQQKVLSEIPIIFLTVAAEINDKLEGFRLGAVDYVTKPFHKEELIARLKTHLQLYRYNQLFREQTAEKIIKSEKELKDRNKELIATTEALKETEKAIQKKNKELINAKKKIEESEAKFRGLFNKVADAIFIYNPDNFEILEANQATSEIYGYSPNELIGMSCLKFSAEVNKSKAVADKIQKEGKAVVNIRHHQKKDGSDVFVCLSGYKTFVNGEEITFAVCQDITEKIKIEIAQKENEIELRKQANFMEALFNHSLDCVAILDKDYNFIRVSTAYANAAQKEVSEFIGKNHFDIYPSDFKEEADAIKKSKTIYYKEARPFVYPDHPEWGITYWNVGFVPVLDRNNEIELFILTLKDVTEQTKIKQELISAKERAEESDRLKTEFINNMSHEIRTPMNGILGFSRLIGKPGKSKEKLDNYINIIQNSGNQLLRIIDEILEISQLGTKQVKVSENEICLNDFLLNLFSIFDLKAKENKIPLYIKKGLSDIESIIIVDEVKLNKILSNIIENAIKFTYTGYIEFGYTLKASLLELYVKDTGIGIKKDKQEIIFERFSQEEKGLSKNTGGLGLGLSIAKENVELLGGTITLQSEKGKGSTFFISIPYNPVKLKNGNNNTDGIKDKYTILIVEDEEVNYLYIQALIEDEIETECFTIHAKNGQEAVDICKANSKIDLVLMDLKMPDMNGIEATKIIKEFRPDLPIIAQTAYTTKIDREKALSVGCDDFISKPIKEETLKNIINMFLLNHNRILS